MSRVRWWRTLVGSDPADGDSIVMASGLPTWGVPGGAPEIGNVADTVRYSIDYATLANNTLTGTETLDGRDYTILSEANATLLRILNGTGLHFDASVNNNVFTSGTQTAPRLEIPWNELLDTDFNPSRRYRLDLRIASATLPQSGNSICFGISPAGSGYGNLAYARYFNNGGTVGARHDGPGASSAGFDAATYDVLSLLVSQESCRTFAGTYSGGYPELRSMTHLGVSGFAFSSAATPGFLVGTSRIIIAFATGSAAGTMDAVIQSLRAVEVP